MTEHARQLTLHRPNSWPIGISIARILLVVIVFLCAILSAQGQTYEILYNFQGSCCATAASALTQGRDDNLYSQISSAGIFNANGSIYYLTPAGSIEVVSNFDGVQLQSPSGPLTLGSDGDFYGFTRFGGPFGFGAFFRAAPDGTTTVLHTFTGGVEGVWPYGAPVRGTDGNFYGLNSSLSPSGATVFRVTPTGQLTTLITLDIGHEPGSLFLGKDGNFYGVSNDGTGATLGTLFRLTPAGIWTDIYTFSGTDGAYPNVLVPGPGSNLFGVTHAGGTNGDGVVFTVTLQGALTVIHNFDHTNTLDGSSPNSLFLASDGKFYGTAGGGGSAGQGAIFQITPGGQFLVVNNFNESIGITPLSLVQHTAGKMYGSTNQGGIYHLGTIFVFDLGLKPFVSVAKRKGAVGSAIGIVGNNFLTASKVTFNGVGATFTVSQDGYLTATVPAGATSGYVQVTTSTGAASSITRFIVTH